MCFLFHRLFRNSSLPCDLHSLFNSPVYILGHRHNSHLFGSFHHHNGCEMKQTRCALTEDFHLRVFTAKSGERCRNYNCFYMCLPLFKGPKVMGQLAAQLFHGQVCFIPSLSHLQGADTRSRVNFKCAICIWNLLLSTLNMRSKELTLSVKPAIIRLKNQNKPIREIAKTLGVLKRKNAPVSSATPKDPEDHGKQLWWMTE